MGLDCNHVFQKLTEAEIEKEFNYIGPDRLPETIRLMLSYMHTAVLAAVLIHDLDYAIGGSKNEFYEANKRLKKNMKLCLKNHRKDFTFIGYWIERFHVWVAYKLCNKYGYTGWNAH